MKYFTYLIILIVAVAIVAGFFVVGSPLEERLRKIDELRITHLQTIQSEIVNYWQQKARLPEKLGDLEDSIRGIKIPKDPETSTNYEYKINGPESFSLCANFSRKRESEDSKGGITMPYPVYGENWGHPEGYYCFERKIDKDLYKPVKQAI